MQLSKDPFLIERNPDLLRFFLKKFFLGDSFSFLLSLSAVFVLRSLLFVFCFCFALRFCRRLTFHVPDRGRGINMHTHMHILV